MVVEKRFFEDLDWAEEHHGELMGKYREQWIAVYNKTVVASGDSLAKVKEEAKLRTGRKHIPVYFVDSVSNIYAG